jgi:hypothetical protein
MVNVLVLKAIYRGFIGGIHDLPLSRQAR